MMQMIFGARKPKLFLGKKQVAPKFIPSPAEEERSSALRIIHAGGLVEYYYMAVPAARILEKYPSFILSRPDVFRRPWDAIVRPEEVLVPGQKYFIVPCQTVKKLRRRIKRPSGINSALFSTSQSSTDASAEMNSQQSDHATINTSDVKGSGIMIKSKTKTTPKNQRVRSFGIDNEQDASSVSSEHSTSAAESGEKSPNPQLDGRKRRARSIVQWHPSLTAINENHGVND